MITFLLFSLTIVLCTFSKNAIGLDTVTLLPSLCGTTAMPAGCQIILAHNGVSMGVSEYPVVTNNCSYVILAAMPNQRIRFGIGTGQDEVNVIMHDDGCAGAAMQVIDSDGTTVLAMLCDGVLSRDDEYLSSGDRLTLSVFTTGGNSSILNFTAHYTSFTDDPSCRSDPNFFPCDNGLCVDPAGQCDATLINNCGDFSDNSRGPPGICSSEEETTATSVTTEETTTAATSPTATDADFIWIAGAVVGGLLGTYFLYWLLWRPGYLVWRCSCWRHWCRSYPAETKNPDDLVDLTQANGSAGKDLPAELPSIYGIEKEAHIFR